MTASSLAYDAVPPALLALDLLTRQLRPRLEGELCIGAIGADLQLAWLHVRLGERLETTFLSERPAKVDASLLLGSSEAEALVQSGNLGAASLIISEGDVRLLSRFFQLLAPKSEAK